jgi:hypothetical protein
MADFTFWDDDLGCGLMAMRDGPYKSISATCTFTT